MHVEQTYSAQKAGGGCGERGGEYKNQVNILKIDDCVYRDVDLINYCTKF